MNAPAMPCVPRAPGSENVSLEETIEHGHRVKNVPLKDFAVSHFQEAIALDLTDTDPAAPVAADQTCVAAGACPFAGFRQRKDEHLTCGFLQDKAMRNGALQPQDFGTFVTSFSLT